MGKSVDTTTLSRYTVGERSVTLVSRDMGFSLTKRTARRFQSSRPNFWQSYRWIHSPGD